MVIARAGIRTMLAKRAFLGLLLIVVASVLRARRADLRRGQPAAGGVPGADAPRRSAQFLEQQDIFVFFVTVYVGAGLIANDRRANALQIYLSKPLTRAEYIFGKLAILMTFLLLVTWVPAIVLLIVQIAFAGNFTFFREQRVPVSGDHALLVHRGRAWSSAAMLALSSLSKSSRYVGILYAALIFFTPGALRRAHARDRQHRASRGSRSRRISTQVGDAIFRLPPRYDTPWPVSLLMIVVLVARLGRRPRAPRPRRRGGRVTTPRRHRRRRPPVEVVRPGHRPERRHA